MALINVKMSVAASVSRRYLRYLRRILRGEGKKVSHLQIDDFSAIDCTQFLFRPLLSIEVTPRPCFKSNGTRNFSYGASLLHAWIKQYPRGHKTQWHNVCRIIVQEECLHSRYKEKKKKEKKKKKRNNPVTCHLHPRAFVLRT